MISKKRARRKIETKIESKKWMQKIIIGKRIRKKKKID